MDRKWRGYCGILSLAASLAMLGCGSTGNTNVRAVNASPGLSNFTLQVGQIGIAAGLPYGTEGIQPQGQYATTDSSGNYRHVAAGNNETLSVYSTPGTTLYSTKQTLLPNSSYTIVLLSPAPSFQLQTLTDDDSAPTSGDYKLRVMDTYVGGALDVYITAVGNMPSGNPVVGNIQFQQVSSYMQESPGTLEIQMTPHGVPGTVLATAPFSPAAGSIYSVFLLGPDTGANTYKVLVVNDPVSTSTSSSSSTM
jgi:hypothetical protein